MAASKILHRTETTRGPLMRVSYAHNLRKGRENKKDDGSTKTDYGCTLILPKSDTEGLALLRKLVKDAVTGGWAERGAERFKSGVIRNPILPGDGKEARNKETGEINPGLGEDVVFIRVRSNEPVKVFNAKVQPASDDEIVSGHWGYPVLNAYAWNHPANGDGVSFGVSMVQFVKADESLAGGGSRDPNEYFKAETISTEGAGSAESAADFFDE